MSEPTYIHVRVTTKAKKNTIQKTRENSYRITVKAKPELGAANRQVSELLAAELGVETKQLKLLRGATNCSKLFQLLSN